MTAYPKSHLKAAMALAAFLVIVITALPAQQTQPDTVEPVSLDVAPVTEPAAVPEIEPLLVQQQLRPESQWIHVRVKDGDNLAPGFRISGLGQLIEAGIQADRLVQFGD